jgi:hypothetical protein
MRAAGTLLPRTPASWRSGLHLYRRLDLASYAKCAKFFSENSGPQKAKWLRDRDHQGQAANVRTAGRGPVAKTPNRQPKFEGVSIAMGALRGQRTAAAALCMPAVLGGRVPSSMRRLSHRRYTRRAESPTGRRHSGLVAAPFCEPIAIRRRTASKRWMYKKGLRK